MSTILPGDFAATRVHDHGERYRAIVRIKAELARTNNGEKQFAVLYGTREIVRRESQLVVFSRGGSGVSN